MPLPKDMDQEEKNGEKSADISAAQARENLFVIQSSQERMVKINEQLQDLEKDPKMRGGKKYNSLIRSFCMLSKKYTDNLAVDNELRKIEQEESAVQDDIISLMKRSQEIEEREDKLLKEEDPKLWQQKHETEEAIEKWDRERTRRIANEAYQEAYRRMGREPPNHSTISGNNKEHDEIEKRTLITIKGAKESKEYLIVRKGESGQSSNKRVFGLDI
jgi:hypothetical protein